MSSITRVACSLVLHSDTCSAMLCHILSCVHHVQDPLQNLSGYKKDLVSKMLTPSCDGDARVNTQD